MLRVLKGNPSKRALNDAEPKPAPSTLRPPSWLPGGRARTFWRRFAPMLDGMRVLTQADEDALALLCQELATYVELQRFLRQHGRTYEVETKTGSLMLMPRPEVGMANAAWSNAVKLMDRFGLNPAYRSKLKADVEQDVDPLEELRRRGARSG